MADARQAPYPAETQAKGWRFEVNMEQVRQSDTWALAQMRGWECEALLLLMWAVAWEQKPCGSFPDDEELISARLKVPAEVWERHRKILMRGWWRADDGRLYHDTITARVLAMLDKRASDAARTAKRRATLAGSHGSPSAVTPVSRVTHDGVGGEFDTKHQNQVPEKEDPPKPPRKRRGGKKTEGEQVFVTREQLIADGVPEKLATEWLAIRDEKRLPLTDTAWDETKDQAAQAGMTPEQAIRYSVVRGRAGFRASWIAKDSEGDVPEPGAPQPGAWWETGGGVKAKAAELGIEPWPETYPWAQYRAKVFEAAGPGPWNPPPAPSPAVAGLIDGALRRVPS